MMNKKIFFESVLPWLLVVVLLATLIITNLAPKPEITTLPPDNRIDSLSHIVDSLNLQAIKLRHDYDSVQSNVKTEIKYIQLKNAKDISNIRSYTATQRDSTWSVINP